MAVLYNMLAKCRLLSYGRRLQWRGVPTCPKSPLETPGANRAADSHPLCGFAPGLLPYGRHDVGFQVGRGVR